MKVGSDGVITVEENKSIDTSVEVVEGMQFDRGYVSHFFVTDVEKMEAVFEKPKIILLDKKVNVLKDILPLLEQVAQSRTSLVFIAEDFDGEALSALIVNKLKGILSVVAIKSPGFGDKRDSLMEDLAVITNGQFISEKKGMSLEKFESSYFGTAEKVIVTKDSTTIVEGAGSKENIKKRINEIKTLIDNSTSDYEKETLKSRLAKMSGGVAVLKIGAASEIELKEKKARVEDALHATRAAVEEGIVAGGGVALIQASKCLNDLSGENPDQQTGINIIRKSIEFPLRQIVENAGEDGSVVVNKIKESTDDNFGYNALTEKYENLVENGIVDPKKVTRVALENAASVASMMLSTQVTICEKPDKDKKPEAPMMPNYGDMY
jgi:chaperonin GroEL